MATAGRKLEEMAQLAAEMEKDGVSGEHMKKMWEGQSNVLVAVRVRPLMKHDVIKKNCVRVLDSKVVVILDPASDNKNDVLRANRSREKQYAFDYVFEAGASQDSVYHHTTKFLIHGVLDGFNATVFAYGQTGSGKTYTMIGTQSEPGIMVRVMDDLFHHTSKTGSRSGVHFKVIVSFLEVYNENIRDLLGDVEDYLDLREDPIKGPVVAGITEVEVSNSRAIMELLHQGNARRTQQPTAANEVSSRSHACLQVVVEGKDRAPGTAASIKVGKLSLVDLAGSERAANTQNRGIRLVEGANINRSLLALGNCINALGEKGNKGNFVPYRDSKLTRLLKDSLGGNCRTVMIANISSAESAFEETLNTLKYSNRAKNIKTNVQRNVLNVNFHISEYVQLINNLRGEIKVLKDQLKDGGEASYTPPGVSLPSPKHGARQQPSTPLQVLRESMRSAASMSSASGEGRSLVNNMRQRIVENFQERMQLRRSLIELEDQNVQNSIEVSKRQLIVVQWSEERGMTPGNTALLNRADFAASLQAKAPLEIREAWQECEQIRKAILKNNAMKKNIAKRLRHNEREADKFRSELTDKITGEDRRELMELQYQVGRLELENMELEQHRIVHQSILKGKDLMIQKLRLQVAVRDKVIARQKAILEANDLDSLVGYQQLALVEQNVMGEEGTGGIGVAPPSPPRNLTDMSSLQSDSVDQAADVSGADYIIEDVGQMSPRSSSLGDDRRNPNDPSPTKVPPLRLDDANEEDGEIKLTDIREITLTARDREFVEGGEWSQIGTVELENSPNNSPLHTRRAKAAHSGSTNNKRGSGSIGGGGSNVMDTKFDAQTRKGANKGLRGPRAGRQYVDSATKSKLTQGNARGSEDAKYEADTVVPGDHMSQRQMGVAVGINPLQLPAVGAGGLVPTLPQGRLDDDQRGDGAPNSLKPRIVQGGYGQRKGASRVSLGNGSNVGANNSGGIGSNALGFHNSPRAARGDKREKGKKELETFENLKSNGKWLAGANPVSVGGGGATALDDFSIDLQQQNLQKARQRQRDRERERLRVQLTDDGEESVNTIHSDNSDQSGRDLGEGKKGRPNRRSNNEKVIGPGLGQLIGPDIAGRNRSLPMLQKGR